MLVDKVAKGAVLVLALVALAISASSQESITLLSSVYSVGDPVHIGLEWNSSELVEFWVSHGNFSYRFMPERNITFIPLESGLYSVFLKSGNITLAENFSAGSSRLLYTDREGYYLGETVRIILDSSISGHTIEVLFGNASYVLLGERDNVSFTPQSPGAYIVKAFSGNQTFAHSFSVSLPPPNVSIAFDKSIYSVGETVTISFSEIEGYQLSIKHGNDIFNYIGLQPRIAFVPKLPGNYTVLLSGSNQTFQNSFEVISAEAPEEKPSYTAGKASVLFNMTSKIDNTRNILNVLFGTSPVQSVTAYIRNEQSNPAFNVSVLFISPEVYEVSVSGRVAGEYELVVEVLANGQLVSDSRPVFLEPSSENSSLSPPSARRDDNVIIVDFGNETRARQRTLLDAVLKKSSFDNVTAFVMGHGLNPGFSVAIEHLGNDAFSITIKTDGSVKPDVYTLSVVAQSAGSSFSRSIPFNLGLDDAELRSRLQRMEGKKFRKPVTFRGRAKEQGEVIITEKDSSFDAEFFPGTFVRKILISNLSINGTLELGIEEVPVQKISGIKDRVVSSFAIDPSSLNFSNATVTVKARGTALYKCRNWSFGSQACLGSWEKVMDLVPGNDYSFELSRNDPGFAETGLASINTLKSIYRPGETAEIIMVVLDNAGYLASANVWLNITDPAGSSSLFSTAGGIIQDPAGIYKATYSLTFLEGNYSLAVTASGSGVNSSMFSMFEVRDDFEFDILRSSPVTTDPWKGPFSSYIRIVSYSSPSFDFTEFLPGNFTIVDSGGAVVSESGGKKILKWSSLGNNSAVSYAASPPLLSPELWELGPSEVSYGSNVFVEARPWFLAVDPTSYQMISSIQTINWTYKQNRAINLTTPSENQLGDQESGRIQVASFNTTRRKFVANASELTGVYGQTTNNYQSTKTNNAVYYAVGSFNPPLPNVLNINISIDYNLTLLTFNGSIEIMEINGTLNYCHQRKSTDACDDSARSDYENSSIWIYNYSGLFWLNLTPIPLSSGAERTMTWKINSSIQDYLSSNGIITVRYESNFMQGSLGTESAFAIDYADANVSFRSAQNTSYTNYTTIAGSNFRKISNVDIDINISYYNNSGSVNASNDNPDLEISVYDGNDYNFVYLCNLSALTNNGAVIPVNCSSRITNSSVLQSWNASSNRKMRIRGVFFDEKNSKLDVINWTSVFVSVSTPSKFENIGALNVSASLLMKVEFYNSTTGEWQLSSLMDNTSRNISINQSLDISGIWNTVSFSSLNRVLGTYRAFAALINSTNDVMQDQSGSNISDTFSFMLDFLRLATDSPLNGSSHDASFIWVNVSLNYSSFPSGGWCGYSFSGSANVTMQNNTPIRFHNLTNSSEGNHNVTFYCNDSQNDISYITVYFTATDQTGPSVNLTSPANNAELSDGNVTFIYNVTDIASKIANCTLEFESANNQTNFTIEKGTPQYFNLSVEAGGPYTWRVFCFDNSTTKNIGYSFYRNFLVGQDADSPVVTLREPIDNYNTSNNDITFSYRVNDASSSIANCSLILNGNVNRTNTTVVEQGSFPYQFNNFTVNDLGDGLYNWSVNCTDTSQASNRGASSARKLNVTQDFDFPYITLISPENDYIDSDGDLVFQYNVTDSSSNIANCTLLINNSINTSTASPAEAETNTFTVNGFRDGSYTWRVNCTDDSFQANSNLSGPRNFSVSAVSSIIVLISADRPSYEQGTQANQTASINISTRDVVGNSINASSTTDIILGNTTLSWWNISWGFRKPVFLNETSGASRNLTVKVNITGLGGNISSCDEMRIVYNTSLSHSLVQSKVISGDDSDFCAMAFNANMSANAVRENRYHAYYGNPNAVDPDFPFSFNETNETFNFVFQQNLGTCGNPSGWTNPNNAVDQNDVTSAQISRFGKNSAGGCPYIQGNGSTVAIRGGIIKNVQCGMMVSNDATAAGYGWKIIPYFNNGSTRGTPSSLFASTTTATKYFFDVTYDSLAPNWTFSDIRALDCRVEPTTPDSQDTVRDWYVYSIFINITYNVTLDNNSVIGEAFEFVNRSVNDTGSGGMFIFNKSTSGEKEGWFSAVSVVSKTQYTTTRNFTNFEVVADRTTPSVKLVNPQHGNKSYSPDMIFLFNVSDTFSGIANCSLIINSSINTTISSVSEALTNNFTVAGFRNGNYSWNVNCTDDSTGANYAANSSRNFTVAEDTTPPYVSLSGPVNNYNDTNNNVDFHFTVLDDITLTADCSLYINSTLNRSMTDINADGSMYTFGNNNLSNGGYSWYVNCTDDSASSNSNWTLPRNLTSINDSSPPSVNLEFPENYVQLTNGNVTFRYNVTDSVSGIANCSLYINGTVNQTNTTVTEGMTQNFTVLNLDGSYNWSIRCFDSSENNNSNVSENRTLLVAPDNEGPNINLEFPPNSIQLNSGRITFRYNVTDIASGVMNCSLYLNNTLNMTNITITEQETQNFSLNLSNGDYSWYVNCSDNSANYNTNRSASRNLSIGLDITPPQVNLLSPIDNYNDTNGNILFQYTVDDIGSGIVNCSLIINDIINQTNSTITENIEQNFSASGFRDGNYTWKVNCTDSFSNTGNSTPRNFSVSIDNVGPLVTLVSPLNLTLDTNGNRTFAFTAVDAISGVASCSIIMFDKINLTNSTITEGSLTNITINNIPSGLHNWSVNCTDTSESANVNSSISLLLNVTPDLIGPNVTLRAPPNNTVENDGIRIFSYNVSDASEITSCTVYVGELSFTNSSVTKSLTQNRSASLSANGIFPWNVSCTDASENANVGTSVSWNISILLDSAVPFIALMSPDDSSQYLSNTVVFFYNVTDQSDFSNCSLILNSSLNITNSTRVDKDAKLNFTQTLQNGSYLWRINCTDSTETLLRNTSEERLLVVSPDVVSPVITLLSPANGSQDVDGDVVFMYNVTDFASGIANCSLLFNGTINATNSSTPEGVTLNFSVYGMRNGDYMWSVNCTDNSTAANSAAGEDRRLNVGFDSTPPNVTLVQPANNSVVNTDFVKFEFNVADSESSITNCTLLVNSLINLSNSTLNTTGPNFFGVPMQDGNYTWNVNCSDFYNNSRLSNTFNFTVFNATRISADVFANQTSYEQGQMLNITANTTNNTLPFSGNVYIDVIKGNTTAPWWNSDWKYRIPVSVNASNVSRIDAPVEYAVNFTSILINDLGRHGRYFDNNSVRVVEFSGNRSVEVPSQYANDSAYNNLTNSYFIINWIMNGTTNENEARDYFIYFDDRQSPLKEAAAYSQPNFSYVPSVDNATVQYGGTSTGAGYVVMSAYGESFSLRLSRGDNISNQQNIDYAGAGSIYNISIDADRLTNLNDSIVPVAVYNNYFLKTNQTVYVDSGPVLTRVRMPAYINGSRSSVGELNYTVWFTGREVLLKADLYINFTEANNDPPALFNNLWFAYLFDYESNWGAYVNDMNSSSYYKLHRYRNSGQDDTTGQFNEADWYSEYDAARGSVNFYMERFMVNSVNSTKGIITLDDYYSLAESKLDESDGTGFNYGSDMAIAAGDDYALTAWMLFSSNRSYRRAIDLKNSVESPVIITRSAAQRLMNRTVNETGSSGIFSFNISSINEQVGNYTATVIANRTYFVPAIDYYWFVITPDVTRPVVNISRPEGFNNSQNVSFYYNATDLNNVTNCTLILNRIANLTNLSINMDAENYFTIFSLTEGVYNWSVNCSDAAGNIGNSSVKNITVDMTFPYVNLSSPANGTAFSVSNVSFNFSAFDNFDPNISCDLRINNRLNQTDMGVLNSTFYNVTVIGFNQGTYMWNVTCEDDSTNSNTSLNRFFTVDTGAPGITLNSPQNGTWNSTSSPVYFYYTPSDLSGFTNCSLIVNGAINQTNVSAVISDAENNFSVQNPDEKLYEWTVNCTDATGSRGTAAPYALYIDRTPPHINLSYPLDGNISSNSTIAFNFTAFDNLDPGLLCNVTINSTVNSTNAVSDDNNTAATYAASGFIDGTFLWNVSCIDNASNRNTSVMRNFTVREPPKVTLNAPNGTRAKNTNTTFNFTATDNTGVIQSCQLILNGIPNQTNSTVESGVLAKIKVQNMPDSQYNWTVNCTDRTQINVMNNTNFTFTIDNQGPSITLNTPYEDQAFNTPDITFNFTATDQFGANITLNCNLTLDNVANVTDINLSSGSDNLTTVYGLRQGDHNWSVTCLDDLNNSATSIMVNFTVNAPDLTLNDTHIKFNTTVFEESRNFTINATVFNIGGTTAIGAKVRFYDGDPDNGGVQFGPTFNISSLISGAQATLNISYSFGIGKHYIYVKLDNESEVSELNETNNKANSSFIIPLWNTVYGNVTGSLNLESSGNFTVFSWETTSGTGGHVFSADFDSGITFTNLTGLGIASSGQNETDDFAQADVSLNTTGYWDSINRTFTRNGVALNQTNLTMFQRVVANVPVVNSTNSSSFFTGILWDSGDANNGSYNGSQDLVFVSQISRAGTGRYGVSDFELIVPATLRQLFGPDSTAITFYLELK